MKQISKAEVVRILTSNKSCLLHWGHMDRRLTLKDYAYRCKDIKIRKSLIRTAKANGYCLTFEDGSILNLTDYKNNKLQVSGMFKEDNILLIYNLQRANERWRLDTEFILIYAIL